MPSMQGVNPCRENRTGRSLKGKSGTDVMCDSSVPVLPELIDWHFVQQTCGFESCRPDEVDVLSSYSSPLKKE